MDSKKQVKKGKRKVVKKTVMKGKQVGKVKTGAVVNVSITQPRTTVRRQLASQKAERLSLIPLLTGIQAQSVAMTGNIERLENQRNKLLADAQKHARERAEAVKQGNVIGGQDAHRKQRIAQKNAISTQTELAVRSQESLGGGMDVSSQSLEPEILKPIKVSRGVGETPTKGKPTIARPKKEFGAQTGLPQGLGDFPIRRKITINPRAKTEGGVARMVERFERPDE